LPLDRLVSAYRLPQIVKLDSGQFKLLEQDRDIKEPVQYFNSVEEVAKAFPERVYVMEEITFNVKFERCKMEYATLPLDRLVSAYRLLQIVKLDSVESVEGLRENDYLLDSFMRQWTTITAHSLEEGHYVIGPKIEIPVHYEGSLSCWSRTGTLRSQSVLKQRGGGGQSIPERVYVIGGNNFNVKWASGESNEDTEVYIHHAEHWG
ncbi:hypothetical protein cypCar_00042255, partial [Cyprinus carpio]